jgi:hypothetical protein
MERNGVMPLPPGQTDHALCVPERLVIEEPLRVGDGDRSSGRPVVEDVSAGKAVFRAFDGYSVFALQRKLRGGADEYGRVSSELSIRS